MKRTNKIIMLLAVIVAGTMIATAAVIPFFGQIKTTATVDEQAVQISANGIDWLSYNNPIEYTIPHTSPGGETYCYKQWVRNSALGSVDVSFDTNEYGGITTTYLTPLVVLYAKGDSTAEWTTEEAKVDSYSAKLTMPAGTGWTNDNAEVRIDVSGQSLKLKDTDWRFWTYTPTGMESYALPVEFYADIDDDGIADKIVAGNILGSSVPVTDEWYEMNPDLWKSYGGGFYVWREDGTGYDFFVGADPWAKVVERWGEATLLRVDLGFGPLGSNEAATAYADDFTLNTETYGLDDIKVPLSTPFTLQPGQQLPFYICYTFDLHIGEGTYLLTTEIDATEST